MVIKLQLFYFSSNSWSATNHGAGERNRTPDKLITNQLLYLLSYAGQFSKTI
jgi:hypothetical protein